MPLLPDNTVRNKQSLADRRHSSFETDWRKPQLHENALPYSDSHSLANAPLCTYSSVPKALRDCVELSAQSAGSWGIASAEANSSPYKTSALREVCGKRWCIDGYIHQRE